MDFQLSFLLTFFCLVTVSSSTAPRKHFEPLLSFKGPHILIGDYEHEYDINGTLFVPQAKMFFWEAAGCKFDAA